MENMKNTTKYYVRIEEDSFGFVLDTIHEINEATDHLITQEDYDKFFTLQSEGKQFRVKAEPTGETLFDLVEEYVPEPLPVEPTVTTEERLEALEMAMLEMLGGK